MENEINNTKRLFWPDVIRVFAIFCVVVLHTIYLYPVAVAPYIFRIAETSIPLFVMLSGALLLGKSESYKVFFKKRCLKVLIPWIIWTFIYMLYFVYIRKDNFIVETYFPDLGFSIGQWGKFFWVQFFSGLWFLPLIFSLYILTPFLRIFVKGARKFDFIYILIIWFIVVILMPQIHPGNLFPKWEATVVYAPIQYVGCFLLGYFLVRFKTEFLRLPVWTILPIILAICLLPTTGFLDVGTLIGAIFIFVYSISNSEKIENSINKKIKKLIGAIAQAALGIYIVHSLVAYILLSKTSVFSGFGFIFTIILFVLSFFVVFLIQKIKILRYIV